MHCMYYVLFFLPDVPSWIFVSCLKYFCREKNVPVVSENWLIESIEKNEAQPLDAYDIVSNLAVAGRGSPADKLEPNEEAIETIAAEVRLIMCIEKIAKSWITDNFLNEIKCINCS